jgi:hypothetical protein
METCTVETGLLRKHPCGGKAVTKCTNCEQALCSKHAVPQTSAGHKTFLCPDCAKAWKENEKTMGALPAAPPAGAVPASSAAKKPAEHPKPAPAAKPAPAEKKGEPVVEDSAPLEFTPEKKPDDGKK